MNGRHVFHRVAMLMAVVVGFQGVATARQAAVVDLLPDARIAPLYGFGLETRPGGKTRLHFGTIGWNVGDGPLEARGSRSDTDDPVMTVKQRIRNSAGGYRDRVTPALMIYETGDSHDHWHTRQFMVVNLYSRSAPGGDVYGLRKLGYCLLDAERMPIPPPGSPSTRSYPKGSCGNRTSTSVRTGLSIGYGDDYPPNYAHQWMNITGLRPGTYRICTTIDPFNDFVEKYETNNQRWTDLRIDIAAHQVDVLASQRGPCGPTRD
ncbi:MAG: lysyl oxidase family protein [Ilumatobacteraceae bacterium]